MPAIAVPGVISISISIAIAIAIAIAPTTLRLLYEDAQITVASYGNVALDVGAAYPPVPTATPTWPWICRAGLPSS